MKRVLIRASIITTIFSISCNALAKSPQGEDVEKLYGGKEFVSIATGAKQPISRAPSVASVITYDQMKAMGARNLSEVLETVPGLHVSPSSYGFTPIYSIRGIYTNYNPQVLVLVNGVPITQVYVDNRGFRSSLPIENISRVEVIRGPGSAIYGANAFAGVINVITKNASEIGGTQMGVRAGSFDTQRAWLLHGSTWAGMKVAFTMEWLHSNGDNGRLIQADAQTAFDNVFGTNASLAPGPANTRQKRLDLHLDLSKENWRLHIWNWRQYDLGLGPGIALALDPTGKSSTNNYYTDLVYHNPTLTNNWDFTTRLVYEDFHQSTYENLFPPGAVLPIGQNGNINTTAPTRTVLFQNGLIGTPGGHERNARFRISSFYNGFHRHRLRIGTGVNYADFTPKESKNYGPGVLTGSETVVNGNLTSVTGTPYIFVKKKGRTDYYMFAQDEWSFARDWSLTAGLRDDYYSDFGNTINPRAALVWQTRYDLTTKLLYGRAFRAPSFVELYTINNPVLVGNPNLKPETIDTTELAFNYQPTFNLTTSLNIFRYWINDLIQPVPNQDGSGFIDKNSGAQTGQGFEWRADWTVIKNLKFTTNFALQKSINKSTHSDAGNAPQHQFYARLDWKFLPQWSFVPQINWVMDRKRVAGDPRPPLKDYAIVDLTLRRTEIANHWEVALLVHNLFNTDAREPSPYSAPAASIPNDFPLPGRSIYGELRFNF